MRILFVIGTMGRGGAEVQVRDLALVLAARGHRVAVVVLLPFFEFEAELRTGGVATLSLGMRRGVVSARGIARFVAFTARFRPEVVHAHMFAGVMLARGARALWVLARRPWRVLVSTSHSGREIARGRYMAYRLTSFLSDQWTSVSRAGLEVHRVKGALGGQSAAYLPNGIDVGRFRRRASSREHARKLLGLGGELVWLAIGSFRDGDKDYETMLRAFAQTGSPSRLLVAGDGVLLEPMRQLAHELGLGERVRFLGMRTDVIELLHAADAYVLSSRAEAMPMVLLEAGASSLPVVTTDVGDCADVVRHGTTGVVVPAGDPEALAKALRRVEAMTRAERDEMGEAARSSIAERFSLDAIVDRWEAIYGELLDGSADASVGGARGARR
jgi:glycosyltransferase involved in cell wall biosynthesis